MILNLINGSSFLLLVPMHGMILSLLQNDLQSSIPLSYTTKIPPESLIMIKSTFNTEALTDQTSTQAVTVVDKMRGQ